MIPATLQALNDPVWITIIGWAFVISYYVVSSLFLKHADQADYKGAWIKNGPADIISSVLWCVAALLLIISLLDLIYRQEVSLRFLLHYYVLFTFLFAFVYNVIEWHFPNHFDGVRKGWALELQCLLMSVQAFTTADFTSMKPKRSFSELLTTMQTLLGVFFIAVFVAKAVNLLKPAGP